MRKKRILFVAFILILLTGCWDQHLLKNSRLQYGESFDLDENGKILTTAVIRAISESTRGAGQVTATNVIIKGSGNTIWEARDRIERKVSGELSSNKIRVFLIGEELAKKNLYPILDALYRDRHSPLGAKVIITKGRGTDILELNSVAETLVSEEIFELINVAEENTIVPKQTVQSICPIMFDTGKDFALPYIEETKEHTIDVKGIALFHNQIFTGTKLLGDQSTLLLILQNKKGKKASFTLKVNPDEKDIRKQFITINVEKGKRDLSIDTLDQLKININLDLKIKILEYPNDELTNEKVIKKLNKRISDLMTENANEIIKKIQKENIDIFGLGRDLMAFYPEEWKKIDWEEKYPKMPIKANVNVQIIGTGLIK